ncbi:unnamed protein product [Microthlaspi erraticum]|uniref:Retrotransposon gag domain-containing protein n=1 Tax=Microthlaspi erraticum TaxID=1685480 RepID=A0A6D2LE56_9BRAS|nr:unnamed protein product [Microthlaspi erraticum]
MDSVLSNSQGARSQSQIPSDQITSDVSSAKTADTSKNPITSPTGSSQTASRSSVLIDPVITSAAANSNVPARVKPSVINLVTPVTAENSILPNQISHAIERPHLRIRVKSKDFPITSTPISRKTPTQTVSTSFALARPNPDDQARIKRMLTDLIKSQYDQKISSSKRDEAPPRAPVIQTLIPPMTSLKSSSKRDEAPPRALVIQTLIPPMTSLNSSSKRDEAPLRAHVLQTLVPPMSSPMSSLNIPNSSKSEIGSQPTERLPSPPPKLSGVEPTIFRWPETTASNSSLQAMTQLKNQSTEILSSQPPATARTVVNGNYQQFPATNDLVDRAQFHRANDPTDLARLTKANNSSNRALSHPIPANRIPVDPRNLLDCESFERFQDQTNLAFWQANSTFNQAMSSIPDIDKLCIPEYSGNIDPRAYIRALYLEILRAQFSPEEIEAASCQLFAENLAGPAKNWFATLDENSIDTFDQLLSVFINQYSIFIEPEVSEADLWTLSQAPNESLRSYVNRFKAIIAKIENPNEAVALLAFRNNLWYKSKFREELIVRPPVSLDDALRCALTFATLEEEITLLLEKYRKGELPQHSISIASSVLKSNSSSEVEKFCKIHKKHDHSTEECRSYVKKQKRKARLAKRNKTSSNDNDKASQKRERKSESTTKSHLFLKRNDLTRPNT